MKLCIASGKGGAGKTTVTAALAQAWLEPVLAADLDVEAPNLHLFLHPKLHTEDNVTLTVPELDSTLCIQCGQCRDICQYNAIASFAGHMNFFSDLCHGCGGCFAVCPANALLEGARPLGTVQKGTFLHGRFIMGRSRIGEAMTPPLLRHVLHWLDNMLESTDMDALMDAPPGVSCPAMTAGRSSDAVLLVAEPTPFGLHDFQLAATAFMRLKKPTAVVLNCSGQDPVSEAALLACCAKKELPVLGSLPFDEDAARTYATGKLISTTSPAWHTRLTELAIAVRSFLQRLARQRPDGAV